MPNPYFQFKQFTICHNRCAMKVGTDGVLLGAWTDIAKTENALDIGTGSGLIALMLAQRNRNITVNAIDIDHDAIEQANENIARSPFSKQIRCHHLSLQDFAENSNKEYDLIVSNPPFFSASLKSPDSGRTLARHTDSLLIEELIAISSGLLSKSGRLSIIYPYEYKNMLLKLAEENGLYISRITNVIPSPSSSPKRLLIEFSKGISELTENNLLIEKERHIYSDDFTRLVKDFYLKM